MAGPGAIIHDRIFVSKGEKVFEEGNQAYYAYLIQSGRVRLYKKGEAGEIDIAQLGPGEVFGEMALVTETPRTENVQTLSDCTLIVISRRILQRRLRDSDITVRGLIPALIKRLTEANTALLQRKASLEDLSETLRDVYDSAAAQLPRSQREQFDRTMSPRLDSFMQGLDAFRDRYDHDPDKK